MSVAYFVTTHADSPAESSFHLRQVHRQLLSLLLLGVINCAAGMRPQQQETISVRLMDSEGRALAGVAVTLSGNGIEEQRVLTRSNGEAEFSGIAPGRYDLRFDMAGFFSQSLHDIPVGLSEAGTIVWPIPVSLTVGPVFNQRGS